MRHIGVMTSGGDAPGMNAAIRAVVRRAAAAGVQVSGIRRGFTGVLHGEFTPLPVEAVHDIIHRGGSMLLTGRCDEFLEPDAPRHGAERLREAGIAGVICIGGDGSLRGALALSASGMPVVGVPGTIDNDLPGTDATIGFDTAVNTATAAIDRVRDTAAAHERAFVIEVMGRHSGFIALHAGMACGADTILVPEVPWTAEAVCRRLLRVRDMGFRHHLIVLAEGAGRAAELAAILQSATGLETRVTILGHVQRGGAPTAFDRNLASTLGAAAVDQLLDGADRRMVALQAQRVTTVPLEQAVAARRPLDLAAHTLAEALSEW